MSDITLDALTELTTIADNDYFAVHDTSAGALKKVSRANALTNVFLTNVAQSVTAATTFAGPFVLNRTDVVISGDAITVDGNYMRVDTEGGAATDNLQTISGGLANQIIVIQTLNTSRDVTVKHGTGNIFLHGGVDFALTGTRDKLLLICHGGTEWNEIGRGDNS
jgi:hypothetical protein